MTIQMRKSQNIEPTEVKSDAHLPLRVVTSEFQLLLMLMGWNMLCCMLMVSKKL